MKVLVSGGAGFIGSHVVDELLSNNYEVIAIDSLATGFKSNLSERVKLYELDLNAPELEDVFINEKPDYVMHLAAQASVMTSMDHPYLDFLSNAAGTVNILNLSEKYKVKKFLFSSTAAVYGEPDYLPINENHPSNPQSFYALSKLTAENYIHFYQKNELNSTILRFSNVYGPRQNAQGEAGVISIFINRLLANDQVHIYGGSQTRDFIYVKDVARACRLILEGEHFGVFNISSCTETVIDDLFQMIVKETGVKAFPVYEETRIGEIERSILDNGRARQRLNWSPQYSLQQGLKETVQYYLKNHLHNNETP